MIYAIVFGFAVSITSTPGRVTEVLVTPCECSLTKAYPDIWKVFEIQRFFSCKCIVFIFSLPFCSLFVYSFEAAVFIVSAGKQKMKCLKLFGIWLFFQPDHLVFLNSDIISQIKFSGIRGRERTVKRIKTIFVTYSLVRHEAVCSARLDRQMSGERT
jgi:hypothetical protein